MSVRDIFSNFKITGFDTFLNGQGLLEVGSWTTKPQDQSVASVTSMILNVWDIAVTKITNITEINIHYTDLDSDSFYADPAFIAANSIPDPGNLGNTILDLDTGLPVELPYDVDVSGALNIEINIPNPLGTHRYVFVEIKETAGNNLNISGNCYRGPLRYSGES